MHAQLEVLLELQDLRAQRRELEEQAADEGAESVERDVFQVQVNEASGHLESKIHELEERLEGPVRDRYQRLVRERGRALVPVIDGVCFGCFMTLPAALASETQANEQLRVCQSCGRFHYFVS